MSGYLPSYQLGGPGEALCHRPGDDQRGKRGHVEDFHLITHKHTPDSPPVSSAAMLEVKLTGFRVSRGQGEKGEEPAASRCDSLLR